MPGIVDFLNRYPDASVSALFLDRVVNLLEEGIDVGVRIGDLPDSTMRAIPVGFVRRVVCPSPRYLNLHGEPREPGDLPRHTIVAASPVSPSIEWRFAAGKQIVTAKAQPRLSVTSNDAAIHAALLGFGVDPADVLPASGAFGHWQTEAHSGDLRATTTTDPRHSPRGEAGVCKGARLCRLAGRAIAGAGRARLRQGRPRTKWRVLGHPAGFRRSVLFGTVGRSNAAVPVLGLAFRRTDARPKGPPIRIDARTWRRGYGAVDPELGDDCVRLGGRSSAASSRYIGGVIQRATPLANRAVAIRLRTIA